MTLSKLLRRIIYILFLIGSMLLFVLEVTTIRQSIIDQMSANLDTAITALGLVLQGTLLNDDKVLAETIVNAMFDGGFVNSVTLIDPDGQVLFQKVFSAAQQNVPVWLSAVIDMPPVIVEQELTDGWRMLGTLTLEGHSAYAYQHLWNAVSRTSLALLAGLVVFTLVISWVCKLLLQPLEQINQQLTKLRKHQYHTPLPIPWLQDLKEVALSINKLITERKRDQLQQRLKITQLSKQLAPQQPQPLLGLQKVKGGHLQSFVSTQGEITLYRRFIPETLLTTESSLDTFSSVLEHWQQLDVKGIVLPLSLLNHPQWSDIATRLSRARNKTIDWRWDIDTFPDQGQSNLLMLQEQGIELAFSAIPFNTDTFNQLDPLNPVFITCQLSDAALFWNLLSQTMHAAGFTLLAEAGISGGVDMLRNWGIDGYAKEISV